MTQPSSTHTNEQLKQAHAQSLLTASQLFQAALDGNLQLDALQREVELWKTSYIQAERSKSQLEKDLIYLQREAPMGANGQRANGQGEGEGEGSNFMAVLIDGDGTVFHESLVSQGAQGGKMAAKLLLSSLPNLIQSTVPEVAKQKGISSLTGNVMVNVFVNRYGLAGALAKSGLVQSVSMVTEFLMGLCQAHDSLNVIDSGPGKEATDSKIIAQLRFYGQINQCGLIVLAGSHDAGYANPIRSLTTQGKNIILLKGIDVAFQLEGLCPVGEIKGLFRTDKVPNIDSGPPQTKNLFTPSKSLGMNAFLGRTPASKGNVPVVQPTPAPKVTAPAAAQASPGPDGTPLNRKARRKLVREAAQAQAAVPATTSTATESESENDLDAFTDISDDSSEAIEEIDFATFDAAARLEDLSLNSSTLAQGFTIKKSSPLDVGASKKSQSRKEKVVQARNQAENAGLASNAVNASEEKIPVTGDEKALRFLQPRPCHKAYLTVGGCDNRSCSFGHNYELSKRHLIYMSKLVKDMPCPYAKLNRCNDTPETCIYGHICPHAKDCTWGAQCRFNELPDGGHGGWKQH